MVNLATYVGSSQAGFPGALLATLAVVLPSFFIILLVMGLLKNALRHPYVQAILRGLKPCVIGIVLATGVFMMLSNCFTPASGVSVQIRPLILTFVLSTLMFGSRRLPGKKMTPITLMIVSAVLGIIIYSF